MTNFISSIALHVTSITPFIHKYDEVRIEDSVQCIFVHFHPINNLKFTIKYDYIYIFLFGVLHLSLNEVHSVIPHHLDCLEYIDNIFINYLSDALQHSAEDRCTTNSTPGYEKRCKGLTCVNYLYFLFTLKTLPLWKKNRAFQLLFPLQKYINAHKYNHTTGE